MRGRVSIRALAPAWVLLAASVAAVFAGRAAAAASLYALTPCAAGSAALCGYVSTPLDASGQVSGTVSLYVQKLPVAGAPRGTIFLLSGGPGQAATLTFRLAGNDDFWHQMLPGYDLVAFDVRGTGGSSPIDSRAAALPFYGTRSNSADIDAVRQALGLDRIVLDGTSYGTELALSYASLYPGAVAGLVLDSTTLPSGRDPFELNVLQSAPAGLAALCANGTCSAATSNFPRDVATLANRLEKRPLAASVPFWGEKLNGLLDGLQVLSLAVSSDLESGIGAELPAAVSAALRGDGAPLLRLEYLLAIAGSDPDPTGFNSALFQATVCDDGPFPWTASTPLGFRQSTVNAAVAALPPGSTGPFGSWATRIGAAELCTNWPVPTAGQNPIDTATLPDVPVLLLSGDEDLRTPTADARAVARLFPHAQLTIAHGRGHAVQGSDQNSCPDLAVKTWLAGGTVPTDCPRVAPPVMPLGMLARTAAALTPRGTRKAQTLAAVLETVQDASASAVTVQDAKLARQRGVPGLAGGSFVPSGHGGTVLKLRAYELYPGIAVSGTVTLQPVPGASLQPVGVVSVSGANAAPARIVFAAGSRRVSWLPTR